MIRRLLLALALLPLALAVLAAAAVAVFLVRPELVLTEPVAAAALKRFGAAYEPRWSRLSFSAASAGRLRHRYVLLAEDPCAEDPRGAFKGCLKRLRVAAIVRWSVRGPRLEVLEDLEAYGGRVEADFRRRAASGGGGATLPFVRSVRLEVPELLLRFDGLTAAGGVVARTDAAGPRPVSLTADFMTRGPRAVGRVRAEVAADTDLFNGGTPSFLDAVARVDARGLGRARASLKALRGGSRYALTGGAEVVPSTGPLAAARLSRCRGAAGLLGVELSCRYELTATRPPGARFGDLTRAAGQVRAEGRLREGRLSASVRGTVDPVGAWYELSGGGEAKLEGRMDRPWSEMTLSHEARVKLLVRRFENLVAFLRETPYAVPAPVHVLTGPVTLRVESRGDPRADLQLLRYVLTTDLSGARQRLAARAEGRVTVSRSRAEAGAYEHAGEVILEDVALELPKLAAGPAPKITLDSRIHSGEQPPAVSSSPAGAPRRERAWPVRSRIGLRTAKPLLLFSNLAKQAVPVSLALGLKHPPAAVGGVIGITKFDVELFRRTATIDHLNITLSTGSSVGVLEGLVLYSAPSTLIRIAILGTTERPRIELSSVPPLKREDIIGLLIFGKNPNELDPEQTASVSNTETALESRAFGLASLFLFGATPIEHVGYDPATKTTTVKLRLPGGAHLTLGSDFDQSRQLSVRKPLSPHWAIQSEISEQGRQSKAATTFLEWLNRY